MEKIPILFKGLNTGGKNFMHRKRRRELGFVISKVHRSEDNFRYRAYLNYKTYPKKLRSRPNDTVWPTHLA